MIKFNLTKNIKRGKLFDANFDLPDGKYILTGTNGCGKSTLLNIIHGLDIDFNGSIDIKYKTIMLTQRNYMDRGFKISEMIDYVCGTYEQDLLNELIDLLEFDEVYKTNKFISKLSGGEAQKLNIIVSLLCDGELYLIDEIENNLDKDVVRLIPKIISKIEKNIILVTHEPSIYEQLNLGELNFENNKLVVKKQYLSDYKVVQSIDRVKRYEKFIINKMLGYLIFAIISTFIITLSFTQSLSWTINISSNNLSGNEMFSENVAIITPPSESPPFEIYGINSWLTKTKGWFDEEFKLFLEKSEYVDKLLIIPSPTGSKNNVNYLLNDSVNINVDSINFESTIGSKYDQEEVFISNQPFSISNSPTYKEVMDNTNYNVKYIGKLVEGTYPKDDSNELVISIYMAQYLMQNQQLDDIKDLINKDVSFNFEEYQTNKKNKYTFKISGIFIPNRATNELTGFTGFSLNNVQESYNSYCYIKKDIDKINECIGVDNNGIYPSFYVETENIEKLNEEIKNYDEFIFVDSLYNRENNTSKIFMKDKILKMNIQNGLILILTIIFIILLSYKYLKTLFKKIYILILNGESVLNINKLVNNYFKKMLLFINISITSYLSYVSYLQYNIDSTIFLKAHEYISLIIIAIVINLSYFIAFKYFKRKIVNFSKDPLS